MENFDGCYGLLVASLVLLALRSGEPEFQSARRGSMMVATTNRST